MNERNVGTKIPIGFQQDDLWQELLGKREDPLRDLAEAGISTLEWAIRTDFSETLYLEKGGVHLTQVPPICSMSVYECSTESSCWKRLPADVPRISEVVCR